MLLQPIQQHRPGRRKLIVSIGPALGDRVREHPVKVRRLGHRQHHIVRKDDLPNDGLVRIVQLVGFPSDPDPELERFNDTDVFRIRGISRQWRAPTLALECRPGHHGVRPARSNATIPIDRRNEPTGFLPTLLHSLDSFRHHIGWVRRIETSPTLQLSPWNFEPMATETPLLHPHHRDRRVHAKVVGGHDRHRRVPSHLFVHHFRHLLCDDAPHVIDDGVAELIHFRDEGPISIDEILLHNIRTKHRGPMVVENAPVEHEAVLDPQIAEGIRRLLLCVPLQELVEELCFDFVLPTTPLDAVRGFRPVQHLGDVRGHRRDLGRCHRQDVVPRMPALQLVEIPLRRRLERIEHVVGDIELSRPVIDGREPDVGVVLDQLADFFRKLLVRTQPIRQLGIHPIALLDLIPGRTRTATPGVPSGFLIRSRMVPSD